MGRFSKRSPLLFVGTLFLSIGVPYFKHLCPLLSKSTPIVTTSSGQMQGRIGYSLRSGKEFWQFLKVPYAQAPLGKMRFEPPQPVEPWEGVKQVVKYPPHCLQYDALVMQKVQGEEDCLFLNVFVSSPTNKPPAKLKPVLVFIHGGGFLSSGSRTYHPDFFMDQDDIILVTLNYRLGPFGFLNLNPTREDSSYLQIPRGNMGLKDQNLALRWIQANIAFFGGDPNRVTLFGESAGGASVHLHMLSPQSRGLFHKAIALSGSAFNPWALSKDVKKVSQKFVKNLGCPLNDEKLLMECLQNADAGEMVKLQQVLQEPTVENDLLIPTVEEVITEDTFLSEYPADIVKAGKGAKIPLILGVNSGEGGLITARFDAMPHITRRLEKIWRSKLTSFASGSEDNNLDPNLLEKIRCHYFGNNETFTSLDTWKFQESLSKMSSDSLFFIPAHRAALSHARSGAPTYLYHFDYKAVHLPSTYSGFRAVTPNDWMFPWGKVVSTMIFDWIVEHTVGAHRGPRRFGISHAEDLYQAWNLEGMTGYFAGWDKEFSNDFIEMFVQFARGDEKSSLSFGGVPWPALNPSEYSGEDEKPLRCMLMDNSEIPKMILEPYAESLEFWASLGLES